MASDESLLEVGGPPHPSLHVLATEEVLSLSDELVSSHLDVLVEQVAPEDLLLILSIEELGVEEGVAQYSLSNKLEVLVMEEHIVVVEEEEGHDRQVHHVLLE